MVPSFNVKSLGFLYSSWVGDEGVVTHAELCRQKSSTVYCHQQCTKDTFKPNSFLLVKLCDHLKPNVNSVWNFFHPQSKCLVAQIPIEILQNNVK